MRILLSRTDRVGDLILSTPTIATLRRSFPAAHITLVCSRYNSVVVDGSPDLDEVIAVPSEIEPGVVGRRFRGQVDLAIALAPRSADIQLVGATRAQRRIGYTYVSRFAARIAARFALTDVLVSEADPRLADERDPYLVRHEVEQVLALARCAGATEISEELVVRVRPADRKRAGDIPAGGIAVHLAPRWLRDGSTLDNFTALLRDLRRFDRPIIVTAGEDVHADLGALRASGAADHLASGLPFAAWAAVFERSACVVTVDTGATHVASAMRRPTVVLFEHRYFRLCSQEWSPWRVPSILVRKAASDAEEAMAATRSEIVSGVARLLP